MLFCIFQISPINKWYFLNSKKIRFGLEKKEEVPGGNSRVRRSVGREEVCGAKGLRVKGGEKGGKETKGPGGGREER